MATLKDLSKHLNISVTQVSRALNGHTDVSENTRERVLEAAKLLNYHPNVVAQKLVSGRSGIVALVASNTPTPTRDPIFLASVTGLSQAFSQRGMQFVLHIADTHDDVINVYARLTRSGAIDGFVIINPEVNDPRIAFLEKSDTPFVVHGRSETNPKYPYFDIDNEGVGEILTRHLIELGHRRIAFINGNERMGYSRARLAGYRHAIEAAGEKYDPQLVIHGTMSESLGMISTIRLFDKKAKQPTAIICGSLLIAKGVYSALRALSLSVPHDVSVVAHDDDPPEMQASAFFPPITVTRSPLSESWGPLADFLNARIAGKQGIEQQKRIEPNFVAGQSSASSKD